MIIYDIIFKNSKYYHDYHQKKYPVKYLSWVSTNFDLGLVYVRLGKVDSARFKLTKWSDHLRTNNYTRFHYELLYAEILVAQDSLAKAISVCNKITPYEILPTSNESLVNANLPFCKDVLARAYYKNGKLEGLCKRWNENGQLFIKENYKNGQKEGLRRVWDEDGQIWYEINYKNGKREGMCRLWNENGQLEHEEKL